MEHSNIHIKYLLNEMQFNMFTFFYENLWKLIIKEYPPGQLGLERKSISLLT